MENGKNSRMLLVPNLASKEDIAAAVNFKKKILINYLIQKAIGFLTAKKTPEKQYVWFAIES